MKRICRKTRNIASIEAAHIASIEAKVEQAAHEASQRRINRADCELCGGDIPPSGTYYTDGYNILCPSCYDERVEKRR